MRLQVGLLFLLGWWPMAIAAAAVCCQAAPPLGRGQSLTAGAGARMSLAEGKTAWAGALGLRIDSVTVRAKYKAAGHPAVAAVPVAGCVTCSPKPKEPCGSKLAAA